MEKKFKTIVTIIIVVITLYAFINYLMEESSAAMPSMNVINEKLTGQMIVHYIDVDQGDASFIELPNDETLLIDAGEANKAQTVINYIKSLGYKKINYVIGTHPHTDHIGGLSDVINNFEVDSIYMPKISTNTKTFENLLLTIKNKGLDIKKAFSNVYISNYENFSMYFIAPNNDTYTDLNNYSAVLKIEYKDKSFLFMADAEKISEDEITADIKSDVVRVGHHGSAYSSSPKFVYKTKAAYAIISVGKNNQYNLPAKEIITRWENSGSKIYRTDTSGTIKVKTDGRNLEIETER